MFIQCFEEIRNSVRAGSHFQKGKEQCWDSTGTEGEQSSQKLNTSLFSERFWDIWENTCQQLPTSRHWERNKSCETGDAAEAVQWQCCWYQSENSGTRVTGAAAALPEGKFCFDIPKPRALLLPSYSNLQHKNWDRVVGLDKTKCTPVNTLILKRRN